MPATSYPVPDGYIVWRENDGTYYISKRPVKPIISAPDRTAALKKLYLYLQIHSVQTEEVAE